MRRWLVITGCIAALMLLWQFLPAIEAWFSPHETNASARKRGLRPSGSSVTD
ncbi:TPA: 2-alkenal reductase, partial [Klebsiella pneumoniae]|nr:2-alkenal reductase [Klebsiella pneumoniae]HCA0405128.1 2-alkenal reductase [Klebsiella pneumoniae]